MSFLEMLDILNDRLIDQGEEPVAFEHDCREGICGSCGMMINGQAHGPQRGTATCQLHMRKFQRRRRHHRRAVAGRRLPGREGPRRQPLGVRPHRRVRRLHHRQRRRRPRGQPHPGPEGGRRRRLRRRRVHRLRRLRGGVPERRRPAVHVGEGRPPQPAARRARPSATSGSRPWSTRWRSSSAPAPTTASARRRARSRSRIDYIALMNRDYVKAKFKNRRLAGQR